jgi:hypothetical protein
MTGARRRDVTIVDACTHRGQGGSPTAVLIDDANHPSRPTALEAMDGTS